MAIRLTSSAFGHGDSIPADYTCEGQNMSPPLAWSMVPAETQSIALIADDPDAPGGTWTHWVIFNIPPDTKGLNYNLPNSDTLPNGVLQGINDFRTIGYGGPCPPRGKPHRYFFKLYALDTLLALKSEAIRQDLEDAIHGHVLDEGLLMATFARR